MPPRHLVHGGEDRGRLGIGLAAAALVPVPAALGVGHALLLRVEHQKALARCNAVHARDGGQVTSRLAAPVQHDEQRKSLARCSHQPRRHKQVKAPRTRRAGSHASNPLLRRVGQFGPLGCRLGCHLALRPCLR